MKKNLKLLTWVVAALFIFATTAQGQRNSEVDDALDDKSKLKGLHVGSYVGFSYNNGWLLDFSPGVGYAVKDWLILGAGINYSYSSTFDYFAQNDKVTSRTIGPRVFAKANVFSQFYAVAEYQYQSFNVKYRDPLGNVQDNVVNFCEDCDPTVDPNCAENCFNRTESALFLGGGYSSSFGERLGFYTEFIIDVLYDRINSPRNSPYTVRVGVFYTF